MSLIDLILGQTGEHRGTSGVVLDELLDEGDQGLRYVLLAEMPYARQFDHRGLGEESLEVADGVALSDSEVHVARGEHGGFGFDGLEVSVLYSFEHVVNESSIVDVERKLDAAEVALVMLYAWDCARSTRRRRLAT